MVACEEHDCERRKPARARGMTASIGLSHVDGERALGDLQMSEDRAEDIIAPPPGLSIGRR